MDIVQSGGLVLIIVAFCEALKAAGLNNRWIPLLAILLGVAGGYFLGGKEFVSILQGVISGLGSSGLYDFGKKTVLGK